LAPGHMPSEAKIENFIRTKYESKRWVMDGPMPDPSTLEVEGDDDVVSFCHTAIELDQISNQISP
jgi:stromal membrane-associated protein